jgi:hypothetical protein
MLNMYNININNTKNSPILTMNAPIFYQKMNKNTPAVAAGAGRPREGNAAVMGVRRSHPVEEALRIFS